jgi:hypothetical protein
MVDEFEKWVSLHQTWLEDKRVFIEFKRRDTPSVAGIATLESESIVASVTVWDSGSCDVDMLSLDTGKPVFGKRYDFASFDQMVPVLEQVCNKMTAE